MDNVAELIAEAPAMVREPKSNGPAPEFGSFRTVADLKAIRPPGYNIEGLLQQGTTALLWGLPGTTKTTHATDWWARLSLGYDWRGVETRKGITVYLPLEDRPGFRARVDAWEEHNETKLPPWAVWWDGDFDFSEDCIMAVRQAMLEQQREHNLPVIFLCLDPIMKVYGEGTALDEGDFRKRLKAIETMMAPFEEATAVAVQHSGWDGKHELGSILQRALTATSIKATANGNAAALTIIRQKNDEEGRTFTFSKKPLGGKGKIVMVPDDGAVMKSAKLTGQNKLAYDALVKAVDDGNEAGHTLPPLSESLSARCPVDRWQAEFKRFRSDGADMVADNIGRAFRRAKNNLKNLGIIGLYDDFACIVWGQADKVDMGADK